MKEQSAFIRPYDCRYCYEHFNTIWHIGAHDDIKCGRDFGGSDDWGRHCERPIGHSWFCADQLSPRWLQRLFPLVAA